MVVVVVGVVRRRDARLRHVTAVGAGRAEEGVVGDELGRAIVAFDVAVVGRVRVAVRPVAAEVEAGTCAVPAAPAEEGAEVTAEEGAERRRADADDADRRLYEAVGGLEFSVSPCFEKGGC